MKYVESKKKKKRTKLFNTLTRSVQLENEYNSLMTSNPTGFKPLRICLYPHWDTEAQATSAEWHKKNFVVFILPCFREELKV